MDFAAIGLGKIARDQHLPAVAESDFFTLAATVDPDQKADGTPSFESVEALVDSGFQGAVAICTPPAVRFAVAQAALAGGLHVMLEKPPCLSLTQVEDLTADADRAGCTLFTAWHSREADMVAPARKWLEGRSVRQVQIVWREDIRQWHPGQHWILQEGGFGVFDPGINALSILTEILPGTVEVTGCRLDNPENYASPIAASMQMRLAGGAEAHADLDFRESGTQTWEIRIETDDGSMVLADGGACLTIGGQAVPSEGGAGEYARLYSRFADLIGAGASDVDSAPLGIVLEALKVGEKRKVEPFAF
ncbi:Gfo/Idh/MocA family oxidoreductase [Erythrobacter sp. LQ02-29]|uniref:Gfo/Idh/MocA family protein n=1 Tax=Erythrobacter sp. LQ02-29 TaxID=2920384 RepID=UPI001F4DF084|nr:Gfo/Idh/MocA family oxidoreductase [Erythrobacter sp. LQ02-29]MCP9222629.1 Gfo/Idh/MocA family oxidoreductase [Erythrobacter sp. LQ02-29]